MEFVDANFVVIGGGISGVCCSQELARLNFSENIVLITATDVLKESRSVMKITENLEEVKVFECSSNHFSLDNPNISIIQGIVTGVDTKRKLVFLQDGTTFRYSKLCICTGARPKFVTQSPNIIAIRDLQSIMALRERLSKGSRVVVLGNGGIAMELVHELFAWEVLWLVREAHIGNSFFDASASEFLMPSLIGRVNRTSPQQPSVLQHSPHTEFSPITSSISGPVVVGRALGPNWAANVAASTSGSSTSTQQCGALHLLFQQELRAVSDLPPGAPPVTRSWTAVEGPTSPLSREEQECCCMASEDDCISGFAVLGLTSAGMVISADFLVSATGVSPVVDFLAGNEDIRCSADGIVVGGDMQTTANDVYAAGDCCSVQLSEEETATGLWFQMKLWGQARSMGFVAAASMTASACCEVRDTACPFLLFTHVTQFFGYRVVLLGRFNSQGLGGETERAVRRFTASSNSSITAFGAQGSNAETEVWLRTTPGKEYIKLIVHRGKVVGALLIGDTELEETLENLILNGLSVSHYGIGLLDPEVDLGDYFD